MRRANCKICDTGLVSSKNFTDKYFFICTNCGEYYLINSLSTNINLFDNDKKYFYKVSSYIYEQNNQFNKQPEIDYDKLKVILDMKDKKIKEKFDLMMIYLSNLKSNKIDIDKLRVMCWIKKYDEFVILFQRAIRIKYVDGDTDININYKRLTFDGLEYIESLEHINQNSKNIFVAFNFEDNLQEIFNTHLKVGIENEGFNYIVVNQDNVEHNKSINDEIIVKLKSSRIVIADFTNHRNSVYFEAGYAMGMNIPIIWTCQEGHEEEMSFDTRQFPHIIWKDKDDLVKQVINRIKVII